MIYISLFDNKQVKHILTEAPEDTNEEVFYEIEIERFATVFGGEGRKKIYYNPEKDELWKNNME